MATAEVKLLDAIVGRYRLQFGLGMELRRKGNKLTIQADGELESRQRGRVLSVGVRRRVAAEAQSRWHVQFHMVADVMHHGELLVSHLGDQVVPMRLPGELVQTSARTGARRVRARSPPQAHQGNRESSPATIQDWRRFPGLLSRNEVTGLKTLSEPVDDFLGPRGLLNYGRGGPMLLNRVSCISGMNNEGDFPLCEAPTNRSGALGTQAKVDDRPRQIWVFGHGQRGIEVRGSNHARAGLSKLPFYVVCDQWMILHKEYEFARKQIQRHWCPSERLYGLWQIWGEHSDVTT
jgi:hypothetical protein